MSAFYNIENILSATHESGAAAMKFSVALQKIITL